MCSPICWRIPDDSSRINNWVGSWRVAQMPQDLSTLTYNIDIYIYIIIIEYTGCKKKKTNDLEMLWSLLLGSSQFGGWSLSVHAGFTTNVSRWGPNRMRNQQSYLQAQLIHRTFINCTCLALEYTGRAWNRKADPSGSLDAHPFRITTVATGHKLCENQLLRLA
jgi:hypothetical protein